MKWTLGYMACCMVVLCLFSPRNIGAQPVTPVARAASDKAHVEDLARELTGANELLTQGKHMAAIAAYQQILAEEPDAATRMAAELGIGRAYVAQDPKKAVDHLGAFLGRYGDASPKIVSDARSALADAREAVAASYLAAKQYNQAIDALRELIKDKNTDESRAAKTLEGMAKIYLQLGDKSQAIAAYRELLQRPSPGAADRLVQVRSLLVLVPASTAELEQFIAQNPGAANTVVAEANLLLAKGYEQSKEYRKALAAYQRAASIHGAPVERIVEARAGMARAYHQLGDTKKAIGIFRGLLSDPSLAPERRFAYIKDLQQIDPTADIAADVAVFLNNIHALKEFRADSLDAAGIPANDVIFFAIRSRSDAMDAYKWLLRSTTGRATPAQVQAFAQSIDHPGPKPQFVASPAAKALAAAISSDSPLGAYLKPLLAGEHAEAAKAAWQLAHTPGQEGHYDDWLQAVAKAVQCHDQAFGGRADNFIKWSSNSLNDAAGQPVAANPIADIVGPRPIPAEKLTEPNPELLSRLNRMTDARQLGSLVTQRPFQEPAAQPQPVSPHRRTKWSGRTATPAPAQAAQPQPIQPASTSAAWLPGNDVLILSRRTDPGDYAIPAYRWHLRRTVGRDDPAKLKELNEQLLKGGAARLLSVSDVSKTLATSLSDDAPLREYLRPLLAGDFQTAARVAWRHVYEAANLEAYDMWVEAVAIAIRCHDQHLINGRADAFVQWVHDGLTDKQGKKIAVNPVADLLGNPAPGGEPEPIKPPAEVIDYLNSTKSPQDLKTNLWAPATDVIELTALDAGQIVERYRWRQRQTTGRLDTGLLTQLEKQLQDGGPARVLVVSPVSKALSAAIRDDAPLADYLKPLLAGDHRQAVRVAWQKMLTARTDGEYNQWLAAAVAAVRCYDQSFKRAEDFRKWSVSDLKDAGGKPVEANPIADLLKDEPAAKAKAIKED